MEDNLADVLVQTKASVLIVISLQNYWHFISRKCNSLLSIMESFMPEIGLPVLHAVTF
jgi:hypothetical protein